MANPRRFTDQQIIDAADQLLKNGKNINGTSLRTEIGGGRPDAIMSRYRELVEEGVITESGVLITTEDTNQEKTHDLPPEIAEMQNVMLGDFAMMVERINNLAHNIVEARLNKAIETAKLQTEEAIKKQAQAEEDMKSAYEQAEDTADQLEDAEERNASLKETNIGLTHERDNALTMIGELKAQLTDLKAELTQTNNQLRKAQETNTQLASANSALEQSLSTTEFRTQELSNDLTNVKDALQERTIELAGLAKDLEFEQVANRKLLDEKTVISQQLVDSQEAHKKAESDKASAESNFIATNRELNVQKERVTELQGAVKALQTDIKAKDAEKDQLQSTLSDTRSNLATVTAENKQLSADKERLETALTAANKDKTKG
jgi:chromosome segregation ATPase